MNIITKNAKDMKRLFTMVVAAMMAMVSLCAQGTFATQQVPVNRGGMDDGTVTLRFYDDMPSVPYISVADFQNLMLPYTTIEVVKTGEGTYTLTGPYAEATVNTTTEQFSSDDYMAFTNLMELVRPEMASVYLDGAPYIRYRSMEVSPAEVTVTFDFKKYGIDLRGDDTAVYFPLATLADLYSDLYYHNVGYNGEKVVVLNDNDNAEIANLEPTRTMEVLMEESRNADMAAYSYSELCFVVDHFYGMPGRSPYEDAIRNDGLDKALDTVIENGATIKQLLKSTNMKEYLFGLNCLHIVLNDGGHTNMMADMRVYDALEEEEGEGTETWEENINAMMDDYPELAQAVLDCYYSQFDPSYQQIQVARPTEETYYKRGDTAYLLYNQFGDTNYEAWNDYYNEDCTGDLPAIDEDFLGDLSVVLDALKQADEDPEVKNFVVDLTLNPGGSLDLVLAMTALMGGQSHFYCENVLTGQRQKVYYDVDCNFDGQFDEKDKDVKFNLNFVVLTSCISFSCGNLFPSLMKDMGFPIIGEKSGGGSCALQYFITPEGLQYQLSSARARLTDKNWQNIDGGIEPNYVLDTTYGYYDFYNIAVISEIINSSITTAITNPAAYADSSVLTAEDLWYTLDGRRLKAMPKTKGLYIHGGEKIVIK